LPPLKSNKLFRKNFPEVEQVVSRIGAAEVPTDPMSMEESDVIVKPKPKSEWVSASSKDELADKIKAAIENRFQIWKLIYPTDRNDSTN
jgi:cobalt-zinc-cadmium resistance protein CzcA